MPRTVSAELHAEQSSRGSTASARWWLTTAVVAALLAAAGWWALRAADTSDQAGGVLEHVHGLGVEPSTGALHVGSHYGLFRVDEDAGALAGPISDRVQDFMGFTVAGPDHFLASGHPGKGQDGPSSLGLIESTDGGQSWTNRSLAGQADFHALEYRHGLVYGADAATGDFMVSEDMETWETRSTGAVFDFAVSPTDPGTVIATTAEGPALSTDGGRSFALLENAPLLMLVSWDTQGTVTALDPGGTAYTSKDATSFVRAGSLGAQPEALHTDDEGHVYASVEGGLWRSTDGARTFDRYPSR